MQSRWMGYLAAACLLASTTGSAIAQSAEADYTSFCARCHGATFNSASGRTNPEQLSAVILAGIPERGMPAFRDQLSQARAEALANWISGQIDNRPRVGRMVEAESLNTQRSAGFNLMGLDSSARYVGYFGERSSLCYSNVDLSGVRSIELNYAKGSDEAGRFAVLVGDGIGPARTNLGERTTSSTADWSTFARHRIGLSQPIAGVRELCFYGVQGGGIFNLDSFTLSAAPGESDGITLNVEDVTPPVLSAAGYRFALDKVAEATSELWSMAFLSDGSMIVAQKSGQLLLSKNGAPLERIQGIPAVWNGGQGGLLQVKPHPKHAENGWIYLTLSDPGKNNVTAMTRVVRGKLEGLNWVAQQDIYRAAENFYTQDYAHFGSRMAFDDNYLYFSIGERQQPERAQSLAYPYGKIHRVFDDGRVPGDNPYVGREGALASVWSYGHRNPQGMTRHEATGAIWTAEHGPAGGDEINVIREGFNYGWPLVSHGKHYDGREVGPSPYRDGVEPPTHHFTPSIGISQIEFYMGNKFPKWNDGLLVASLGQQELHLVRFNETKVVSDQLLFKGLGRIRDVVVGPDGYPYLVLNQFSGAVYRMRPVK